MVLARHRAGRAAFRSGCSSRLVCFERLPPGSESSHRVAPRDAGSLLLQLGRQALDLRLELIDRVRAALLQDDIAAARVAHAARAPAAGRGVRRARHSLHVLDFAKSARRGVKASGARSLKCSATTSESVATTRRRRLEQEVVGRRAHRVWWRSLSARTTSLWCAVALCSGGRPTGPRSTHSVRVRVLVHRRAQRRAPISGRRDRGSRGLSFKRVSGLRGSQPSASTMVGRTSRCCGAWLVDELGALSLDLERHVRGQPCRTIRACRTCIPRQG